MEHATSEISDDDVLTLLREGRPLKDLLEEIVSLRKWKETHVKAQTQETYRMERMLTRLCENCKDTASRWIRHQNGSTDDLPVELLHTIFRFVLPPTTLVDPTPSRGPHSPWVKVLASKLRLGRVSKRWHSSVLPFIYEDVSFRYATQVRAFARSLRENPDLAQLVRRMVVDCPVTAEVREVVTNDLAYILARCSGLRALIFTDSLFSMEDLDDIRRIMLYPFPPVLASAIGALSRTLQRFEQWPQGGSQLTHFTFPLSCIASFPQLTALAINIDHPASLEHVVLPTLQELDLSQEYDVRRGDGHAKRFIKWELPRLKRLILPMATDIQGRVLQKWGKTIEYLEFRDHLDMASHLYSDSSHHPYADHIHLCPGLRHLVLQTKAPLNDFNVVNRLPSHPTLAYIDMWTTSPVGDHRAGFIASRAERKLAKEVPWKNIRLLDRALNSIQRLPQLFPPDTPDNELPRVHTIPGLAIVHTAWGVYRMDLDVLYPPLASAREDEDGSTSDNTESSASTDDSDDTYSYEGTVSDDTMTEDADDDGMDVDGT
ncbi:hypothetical protein L226DRAFT_509595 [Lentinus tigrinus ALCF2SS1-7]|uniref:Uncharacterized protein n=1 Tax=Lentinus tigrinus ALCF2SS1-6 TaxID=1328759 RepID=A0A5C2RSL0_9APHY|nr:hypothetical protein L227DRAFT_555944 [Lentinus tigrinus ALCF2SS1-6]RPD73858.1 hypothetical protein L226DRAFT_509595 [Lentinus tigrinus ALCF2SS1-7]